MPGTSQIVLTPKGEAKLRAFVNATAQAAQSFLAFKMASLRSEVALRAPSSEIEAQALSQGTVEGAPVKGRTIEQIQFQLGLVGTPDGGRFIRQGDQVSLREAIATDPVVTRRQLDVMTAGIGDASRINRLTGFYWNTRKRGIQGPTLPFNGAYVQAMEDGGVIWTVVPRPGTRALEPEPGVLAQQMRKTVGPYRMFRGTLFNRADEIRREFAEAIRDRVSERSR